MSYPFLEAMGLTAPEGVDVAYEELLAEVLTSGARKSDRTGTGTLSVSETAGYPIISVGLKIPRFLINNGPMGTAYIRGGFDTKQKQINIDAHILNTEEGVTDVKGYVSLLHKNLDLFIKGTGTDLRFLRRWVGDIFNDLRGKATGHVRLFGPLKQLDLEGEEEVELEAQIAATGAHYKVDGGRVVIRPGLFSFNEIPISILTAFIGAPLFITILRKNSGERR